MNFFRHSQLISRSYKPGVAGRIWLGMLIGLAGLSFSHAQQPVILPPGGAEQMMIQQPLVEIAADDKVAVTAMFEPAAIADGERTFYRVTVDATENSVVWPEKLFAPEGLEFGLSARGQVSRMEGNRFRPLMSFIYEIEPQTNGHFVIPAFDVLVNERRVRIPEAKLDVSPTSRGLTTLRWLTLQTSLTNLFAGQPFRVRVLLPVGEGNQIEALRDVQINGGGLMLDKLSTRQSVETVNLNGVNKAAYVYETVATPMAPGAMNVFAQAFSAGRDFGGAITISGQVTISGGAPRYALLASKPLSLNVRALPEGELPGFTGAMGKFTALPPKFSARRVKVGEPLFLKYEFASGTNLVRFVPPEAPRVPGWQIIAGKLGENTFTLIPLTDEVTNTPVIPFAAFDPVPGKFYDLSIPAQPVTVTGEGLPRQLTAWNAAKRSDEPISLSALAEVPGKTVKSLKPLAWLDWFRYVVLPLWLAVMVWRWDERRRFLAANPDIVRRLEAKCLLRKQRKELRRAVAAHDTEKFIQHSVTALRVAVAPHFPANAPALVGADVLSQLDTASRDGREGDAVRAIFATADGRFAALPAGAKDLLALNADVEKLLEQLEGKL